MTEFIYFEEQIEDHPRAIEIFRRYPRATRIPCGHYKEIFNPNGQNFRLQKKKPALILAQNRGKLVHSVPSTYGIGGKRNFYFSHMLNCLYDCRYCFLQGMYPSAHYLLFINFEDFFREIGVVTDQNPNDGSWFFSGYDCDSLALENLTGFVASALPFFANRSNAFLELRTKSINLKTLAKTEPLPNVVTAFSFTPAEISESLEKGVPSVHARIRAMNKLAQQGWLIGLRLDPILDCQDFDKRYGKLIDDLFSKLPENAVHSVSLGPFRLPDPFFKRMERLYPEEALFAGDFEKRGRSVSYGKEVERERIGICRDLVLRHMPKEKLFICEPMEE